MSSRQAWPRGPFLSSVSWLTLCWMRLYRLHLRQAHTARLCLLLEMAGYIVRAARFSIPDDQCRSACLQLLSQPLRLIEDFQIASEVGLSMILIVRKLDQVALAFDFGYDPVVSLAPISAPIHD